LEKLAFFVDSLRENVKILVKLDTNHSSVRIVQTEPEQIIGCSVNVASRETWQEELHHAQKEEAQSVHTSNFKCHADPRNYKSQDVVSIATWKNEILTDENWIYDSGACGHHYESDKDLFAVKEINEKIIVWNIENMNAMLFNLRVQVLTLHSKNSIMFQNRGWICSASTRQ
jgi:hypothetical protein